MKRFTQASHSPEAERVVSLSARRLTPAKFVCYLTIRSAAAAARFARRSTSNVAAVIPIGQTVQRAPYARHARLCTGV